MTEQLASPFAIAFTWMLLHFLWQGSAIAIVYWTLWGQPASKAERCKPSGKAREMAAEPDGSRRSARNRYAISLSMLAAMAICPIASFVWLYDPNATTEQPVVINRIHDVADQVEIPIYSSKVLNKVVDDKVSTEFALDKHDAIAPTMRIDFTSIRLMLNRWQPYLLMLWGLGVVFSGLRLASGFLNIVWLRSGIQPIPDALKQRSMVLARKLGLNVSRVFTSSRIHEAAVVGFWRPVVLLPTAWLASLPPDVLEAVIAHELAHIRRLDVWVNLLQRLLESLFFYHPAVWWLSNRVRLDREMCCDELAVQVMGNRGQYAIALEQVGRMQVFGTPSLATSFRGDGKMKLYSRIQNILGNYNAPAREPAFLVGIVLAALALVLTGVVGSGVPSSTATAQDRELGFPERERPSQDRREAPHEEEPPLTDRERKLMETVKQLQQELNELRRKVQGENSSDMEAEFRLYDRDRDSEISRQEWFEKFLLDIPRSRASIAGLEKLKRRYDELLKDRGEYDKEVQDLRVTIFVYEDELKEQETSFLEMWNHVDSNRNDIVTQAEFARWWNQGRRLMSGYQRPSQILRSDRLKPLMDQRKMLLGRLSENHPQVADVTIRIESLEERIKSMEEEEKKGLEERTRSSDAARDRGPRDGERMRPGPRDGEIGNRGPRDDERGVQGPRDGDRPSAGPRDGEGGVRGPRDGERPNSGSRDGDRTSNGPRDAEKRSVGPREGEGGIRGPRDSESPKLGPRDGEASRVIFPAKKEIPR